MNANDVVIGVVLVICHTLVNLSWNAAYCMACVSFPFFERNCAICRLYSSSKKAIPIFSFRQQAKLCYCLFFFYRTSPIPIPSDLIPSNPHKREIDQSQISQIRTPSEFRPIPCTCLDSGDGLGGAAEEVVRLACSGVEGTRQKFGN